MRNSFTNERYNLTTEDLDTNLIENLQIKLNSENVITYKKLYLMVEN